MRVIAQQTMQKIIVKVNQEAKVFDNSIHFGLAEVFCEVDVATDARISYEAGCGGMTW